ncbi:putative nuclease HARBI1 [Tanacetum coccineum]
MGDTNLTFTPEQYKFFLESCIEEVNRVKAKGNSLHVESWAIVGRKLSEAFGLTTNQKQLKNKFDYYNGKYKAWAYLRGKTGNIYNEDTKTFNLTKEEWKDLVEVEDDVNSFNKEDGSSAASEHVNLDAGYDSSFEDGSSKEPNVARGRRKKKSEKDSELGELEETMKNAITNIGAQENQDKILGAVGAFDGTLIHASMPSHKQNVYRARGRGDCYQNVLAICDINMIFTYIVARWEGTAHEARILNEALDDPIYEFLIPPSDKYYLCDAAYRHTRGFMAPYRNVRYWLGDFRRKRAMTSKEKFNHAHAKLRNVIERAFGVLKARFPILKRMPKFPLVKQRDITIACFAIHNFIRKEGLSDDFFAEYDQSDIHVHENVRDDNDGDVEVAQPIGSEADQQYMINLRDDIATQIMQARS